MIWWTGAKALDHSMLNASLEAPQGITPEAIDACWSIYSYPAVTSTGTSNPMQRHGRRVKRLWFSPSG
jgi:hypothetical protein